jgi:hypothetical protein
MHEHPRMTDPSAEPDASQVRAWIGPANQSRWDRLAQFIASEYPGVFATRWLYGGKKHGWSLRYKKSKSFCTLIPEHGQFKVLLIFGAEERGKVDALLPRLVSHVRDEYVAAPTLHDGKWVATVVDSDDVLDDIELLLVLKRRPRVRPRQRGPSVE